MNIKTPELDVETRRALAFATNTDAIVPTTPLDIQEATNYVAGVASEAVGVRVSRAKRVYAAAMAKHWEALASTDEPEESTTQTKPQRTPNLRDIG